MSGGGVTGGEAEEVEGDDRRKRNATTMNVVSIIC